MTGVRRAGELCAGGIRCVLGSIYMVLLLLLFLGLRMPALAVAGEAAGDEAVLMAKVTILNVGTIQNGKALYRHYCQVCHGEKGDGNGPNAHNVDPPPADFTDFGRMSERSDAKLFKVISRGGMGAALSKNMPPWGHTLSEEQIWAVLGHVRSFSGTKDSSSPYSTAGASASTVSHDMASAVTDSCKGCHIGKVERDIIAPDLGYERSKFTRGWLTGFLKKPILIRPVGYMPFTKSVMPEFQFSDLEAEALAEYLLHREESTSESEIMQEVGEINISAATTKKGKKLFRRNGCAACHKIGGKGGEVGPDLSKSAHRLKPFWMFKWMKNPQEIRPDAPMPNYNLSDKDAKALVVYMLQVKEESPFPVASTAAGLGMNKDELYSKGKELLEQKNCLGCHYMHSGNDKGYSPSVKPEVVATNVQED